MNLLLNKTSQKRYNAILKNPPQSILLVAPVGSGKNTILSKLAKEIVGQNSVGRLIKIEPLENKNSISIDAVRELKALLKLKSNRKRVFLITQASLMTQESQNSLLKLLEEPPKNVHFLLGVDNLNNLLETIISRTSVWRLNPPTKDQLHKYFEKYNKKDIEKSLSIGGGRTGLISSLLEHSQKHPLLQSIEIAKEILPESSFNRLVRVNKLCEDTDQLNTLIEALELICKSALENAASKNSSSVKQWHKRLKNVVEARDQLNANVQPKLVLSHLFIVL